MAPSFSDIVEEARRREPPGLRDSFFNPTVGSV
jgi:hypothetical protein